MSLLLIAVCIYGLEIASVSIWHAMIFLLPPFNICHFNQMHLYADRFYL